MADSFWLAEPAEPLRLRPLVGEPEVEIVGGGVTGCSCALALARAGVRVRVHDARTIAGGASGRNGGFALRGGSMPYDEARRTLGLDRAKAFWELTERGLQQIQTLAGDAYRQTGSLRLAADEAELAELEVEFRALARGWVRGRVARPAPAAARRLRRGDQASPRRFDPAGSMGAPARAEGGRCRSRAPRALAGRVARRAEGADGGDRDRRVHARARPRAGCGHRPSPQPGRRHRAALGAPVSGLRTTRGAASTTGSRRPTGASSPVGGAAPTKPRTRAKRP